jgi:hypothetical protein
VRVHAAHDHEHGCQDSSTLCQTPIDPPKYLYTLPGCVLGHHHKAFHWLHLVCSAPAEVSPEVSVQITKGPSCIVWFSGESTPLPTRSQPNGSQEPRSISTIGWYAKLASTTYYARPYPCRLMVALFSCSTNQSLDLGMMTTIGFQSPPDKALNC